MFKDIIRDTIIGLRLIYEKHILEPGTGDYIYVGTEPLDEINTVLGMLMGLGLPTRQIQVYDNTKIVDLLGSDQLEYLNSRLHTYARGLVFSHKEYSNLTLKNLVDTISANQPAALTEAMDLRFEEEIKAENPKWQTTVERELNKRQR